ncbi:MAG: hypothetical protein AAFR75_08100 [Pseudomonadota bacterium]
MTVVFLPTHIATVAIACDFLSFSANRVLLVFADDLREENGGIVFFPMPPIID